MQPAIASYSALLTPIGRSPVDIIELPMNSTGDNAEQASAGIDRCIAFLKDELDTFEQFQFVALRDNLERITDSTELLRKLGHTWYAKEPGQGVGSNERIAYASHVSTDGA